MQEPNLTHAIVHNGVTEEQNNWLSGIVNIFFNGELLGDLQGSGRFPGLTDALFEILTSLPTTATCDDGQRNGLEDGVDCGGPCDACRKSLLLCHLY